MVKGLKLSEALRTNPLSLVKMLELRGLRRFASPYCYNYPWAVQIEITNNCNLRCKTCPRLLELENWLAGSLPPAVAFGLGFGLMFWLLGATTDPASIKGRRNQLRALFSLGLSKGRSAGLAVILHSALHYVLWRRGDLPWRLVSFLDYAADCILLHKVGGGYIFIHPMLQDYFASLDTEGTVHEWPGI